MSDDRDIGWAVAGFVFGTWSFFWGFKRLRRKRLIENIPTSTVRGLAMGLVELCGKAEQATLLVSPLTKTKCVLFRYLIEEYRKSGKSGHWVKIAGGDSFYNPFWLNDGTGRIMVFPARAELIWPVDYEFRTGFAREIPGTLLDFMEQNGIRYKIWLGTRTLRFHEWFILPDETVYVLGSALKTETPQADYKYEVQDNPADVVIGKSEDESVFMISDHSEKDLIKKLGVECFLGIYGGAALSLATLAYLLVRLQIF